MSLNVIHGAFKSYWLWSLQCHRHLGVWDKKDIVLSFMRRRIFLYPFSLLILLFWWTPVLNTLVLIIEVEDGKSCTSSMSFSSRFTMQSWPLCVASSEAWSHLARLEKFKFDHGWYEVYWELLPLNIPLIGNLHVVLSRAAVRTTWVGAAARWEGKESGRGPS